MHSSWFEMIGAVLAQSEARITRAGVLDPAYASRVRARVGQFEPLLARVAPVPFLDDTTTKNVIVEDGRLSGIVDVDVVCFGDPIWTIALTTMAMLRDDLDLEYVNAWRNLVDLHRGESIATKHQDPTIRLSVPHPIPSTPVPNKATSE